MPHSDPKQFSGIFVSYRRDDSSGHAGRLYDRLSAQFGNEQIFMDIDHIEPGEDFVQVIENAVGSCEILIAVIGRQWLSNADESSRRLDNPNDFVRLEIVSALNRDIRVIPVLVQGATMPKAVDLPDDLSKLSRRNALELSDLRWQRDVDQLIRALEKILAQREEARRSAKQKEEERQREAEIRRLEEARVVQEELERRELKEAARLEAKRERRREAERQRRKEAERRQQEADQKRQEAAEKESARRVEQSAQVVGVEQVGRESEQGPHRIETGDRNLEDGNRGQRDETDLFPVAGEHVPREATGQSTAGREKSYLSHFGEQPGFHHTSIPITIADLAQTPHKAEEPFPSETRPAIKVEKDLSAGQTVAKREWDTNSLTRMLATGGLPDTNVAGGKKVLVVGGLGAIVIAGAIVLWTQLGGIRASQQATEQTKSVANKPIDPNAKSFTNQAGVELVWIAPGHPFDMGSLNGSADEKPLRHVTISKPFFIGKYEVTQAQWEAVMGSNPSNFKDCGGDCPVEQVSWNDAQRFINKLNDRNDGFIYRLPTESEWEYACRAGTKGDYAGQLSEMAWYSENSGNKTHPVREKREPNAWGLYDMHGNVSEWCEDWYEINYIGARTDGSASQSGERKYRVMRGGSWLGAPDTLRSAARGRASSRDRTNHDGFRLVAVPSANK